MSQVVTAITKTHKNLMPALSPIKCTSDLQFSVISHNILIKTYHYRHYSYLQSEYRTWDFRKQRIIECLRAYDSDIVCLQEAHLPSFELDFRSDLIEPGGYKCIINDLKTKKKKRDKFTMTTPILFKSRKFKCVYFEFRSRASIVLLQSQLHSQSQQYVFVCNVHLDGDPRTPQTRFNQIKSILKRVQLRIEALKLNSNVPIMICGDFNSSKEEVVDHMLLNGGIKKTYVERVYIDGEMRDIPITPSSDYSHLFSFVDAYDSAFESIKASDVSEIKKEEEEEEEEEEESKEKTNETKQTITNRNRMKEFTFVARNVKAIVDYIYFTSPCLKCVNVCETIPKSLRTHDSQIKQLPNEIIVSDHCIIGALFEFK